MIWLGASSVLLKPIYIASIVWPTFTVRIGCCVPEGSRFSTELTLVLISVSALLES